MNALDSLEIAKYKKEHQIKLATFRVNDLMSPKVAETISWFRKVMNFILFILLAC